jgi:hypothetical protein
MFRVTSIVSLILGTIVVGLNRQWLNSLGWVGFVLALSPIAAVFAIHRSRVVARATWIKTSILLYCLSLPIYVIRIATLGEVDALLGFVALVCCFMFSMKVLDVTHLTAAALLGLSPAIMGAIANLSFLIGLFATFAVPNSRRLSCHLAKLSFILSIVLLAPLATMDGFKMLYPGYGLWAASFLALWLGTRHTESNRLPVTA